MFKMLLVVILVDNGGVRGGEVKRWRGGVVKRWRGGEGEGSLSV